MENIDEYLSGRRLYGDDLPPEQIQAWHEDEKEGYANLGAGMTPESGGYGYVYHALNRFHAYRRITPGTAMSVLGFGSAYGDELVPLIRHVGDLTIVDPSDAFRSEKVHGVPCHYVKPAADGVLPLATGQFDLITCFGVLHHIPNVSAVVSELARVLRPGGVLLLREPIVSMGDWRYPRPGLTRHERGIPLGLLRRIVETAGLQIEHEGLCLFPPVAKIVGPLRKDVYNSRSATLLDAFLSRLFAWNLRYHARNALQKLRPTSAFYVLKKPESAAERPCDSA